MADPPTPKLRREGGEESKSPRSKEPAQLDTRRERTKRRGAVFLLNQEAPTGRLGTSRGSGLGFVRVGGNEKSPMNDQEKKITLEKEVWMLKINTDGTPSPFLDKDQSTKAAKPTVSRERGGRRNRLDVVPVASAWGQSSFRGKELSTLEKKEGATGKDGGGVIHNRRTEFDRGRSLITGPGRASLP